VQQPTIDYNNGHSAVKIAPQNRRLIRDFNAPPYQGRVVPGEVPPGYHCVSKHYTLNTYENPRYQLLMVLNTHFDHQHFIQNHGKST
jgi:hypothetical protein